MSRRPAAQTPPAVAVEPAEVITVTVGLRNPPCCGRANAPRLLRTRRIGATRLADGVCTLCGHPLRITYERRGDTWTPVMARDLHRAKTTQPPAAS